MSQWIDEEPVDMQDRLDNAAASRQSRSKALLAAAFDLVSAARRVRSKFGTDDNGNPLDWTEWRDACNALIRRTANNDSTSARRTTGERKDETP